MRRGRAIALGIVLVLGLAPMLAAQDLAQPVHYTLPGMDEVVVHRNLVYRSEAAAETLMDVYVPPDVRDDARLPAVLFIHGGPLGARPDPAPKEWGVYTSYGRLMAAAGLVGVTFNHRYVSMSAKDLETSASDVEAAIAYLRENAATYHVDPDRLALWAFSGGGPHLSIGLRGDKPYIRCLLSFYAVLDVEEQDPGEGARKGAMRKYSPVSHLVPPPNVLPPVLIGRAGLDAPSINRSVDLFVSRMMAVNGDLTLLSHPLGRHGFDILDDDQQTRDTIAAAVAFLQSRLSRKELFAASTARTGQELQVLLMDGRIADARALVKRASADPGLARVTGNLVSESRLGSLAGYLARSNKQAALETRQWVVDLAPLSAEARIALAQACETAGLTGPALEAARRAIELLDASPGLTESRRTAIRGDAEALVRRLEKRSDPPTGESREQWPHVGA